MSVFSPMLHAATLASLPDSFRDIIELKLLKKYIKYTEIGPKTMPLPLLRIFNLRYSLHKLTDLLKCSAPFLHTDKACFFLSAWSKTLTYRDYKHIELVWRETKKQYG